MRSAERRKVNVLKMKCLRIWLECREWIELGMNRWVNRRAGIEKELASRADERILRWLGNVEIINDCR